MSDIIINMKPAAFHTPILLIAFNKPHTTARVFETIKNIRPARLYMAVDGPRGEADKEKCEQNKALLQTIDWQCEVKTLFRERNLGCAVGVTEAITWFFTHEERGIILEDDTVPVPSFFPFCEKMLARYEHDERISIIGGSNFLFGSFKIDGDYYYSNMTHVWGWATWRRFWNTYRLSIADYTDRHKTLLKKAFPRAYLVQHALHRLFMNYAALTELRTTSWDYALFCRALMDSRVSVIPVKNLVVNIGFDGSGNSGGGSDFIHGNMPACDIATDSLRAPASKKPRCRADVFTLRNEFGIMRFRDRLRYISKDVIRLKPTKISSGIRAGIRSALEACYRPFRRTPLGWIYRALLKRPLKRLFKRPLQ